MSITTTQAKVEGSDASAAYLNLAALEATALERDPFDFLVVPDFIAPMINTYASFGMEFIGNSVLIALQQRFTDRIGRRCGR